MNQTSQHFHQLDILFLRGGFLAPLPLLPMYDVQKLLLATKIWPDGATCVLLITWTVIMEIEVIMSHMPISRCSCHRRSIGPLPSVVNILISHFDRNEYCLKPPNP